MQISGFFPELSHFARILRLATLAASAYRNGREALND